MDILGKVKKEIFPEILKPAGFQKKSDVWFKRLDCGIVLMISYSVRSVKKDDFFYRISCGVYCEGVDEFLYGTEFEIIYGIENSLIKSSMDSLMKPSHFNFVPETPPELFYDFVKNYLLNKAIPFLESLNTIDNIKSFLEKDIAKYLKSDSIVLLRLATLYFMTGEQAKGISLTEKIIEDSKLKYEFAENLLKKMLLNRESSPT